MVPHRRDSHLSLANRLFNRKLSRARSVVENAFSLLKMTFKELHGKCDLDVAFVPDVVLCCALLHNVLLKDSHDDIDRLLEVVHGAGHEQRTLATDEEDDVVPAEEGDDEDLDVAVVKRTELGVFLSSQQLAAV